MPKQSRTGYQFVYKYQDRFGVSIAQKDKRFRRDNLPSIYDAVLVLNETGLAKHPLPPSPYKLLDEFIAAHKAPQTETSTFAEIFEQLRGPWRRIARASLTRRLLSKLLRERGYPTYKSGSTLKVRGLKV